MTSSLAQRISALLFIVALVPACGDDGIDPGADGGADLSASTDLSASGDLSGPKPADLAGVDFAGVSCGSMTCGAGSVCCIVPDFDNQTATSMCQSGSTCGDGGIPAVCDGPEDCTPAMSQCCIDLALSGMMSVSGGASCTASCPASVVTENGGSIKTRLCHGAADCTNYSGTAPIVGNAPFDRCCAYPGLTFKFCAPGLLTLAVPEATCD